MRCRPDSCGERCRRPNDIIALSSGAASLTGVRGARACRKGWRESHAVGALGTYSVMV